MTGAISEIPLLRAPRRPKIIPIALTFTPLAWASDLTRSSWGQVHAFLGDLPIAGKYLQSWMVWTGEIVVDVGRLNLIIISCAFLGVIGVVGFAMLRRGKTKEPEEADEQYVEESGDGVEEPVPVRPPSGENWLQERLSEARFPINNRRNLLEVLGRGGSTASVNGTLVLPIEEVVDRCFSKADVFTSPDDVARALSKSSWVSVVMGSVSMLPFPVGTRVELADRLRGKFIDGVPFSELLGDLNFPIDTPADLLSQLSEARARAVSDGGAMGSNMKKTASAVENQEQGTN